MKKAFLLLTLVLLTATLGYSQSGQDGSQENIGAVAGEATPVYIPNAFTPNGDGVNDEYYIPDAGLNKFSFSVFDRWGNKVYATQSANFRWGGEVGGRTLPEGTYVYVLNAVDSKGIAIKRSGPLTIVR